MTRTILASSSIRLVLLCRRPAVSISSTSQRSALRLLQRLVGEARGVGAGPLAITGTPARSPHTLSCSTAAARKVSPAASITLLALAFVEVGELGDGRGLAAAVDADHQHDMRLAAPDRWRAAVATGCRISAMSSAKAARTSSSVTSLPKRSLPSFSTRRAATLTPRSAWISASSSSFSVCLVELLLGEEAGDALGDLLVDLARPSRRRDSQPFFSASFARLRPVLGSPPLRASRSPVRVQASRSPRYPGSATATASPSSGLPFRRCPLRAWVSRSPGHLRKAASGRAHP